MNRRRFIGWLAGTAAALALGVLPRAYGVPASGLVGKPVPLTGRLAITWINKGKARVEVLRLEDSGYAGNQLAWAGGDEATGRPPPSNRRMIWYDLRTGDGNG